MRAWVTYLVLVGLKEDGHRRVRTLSFKVQNSVEWERNCISFSSFERKTEKIQLKKR
jgi:hypothetical protein